jgi:hypothetical protein
VWSGKEFILDSPSFGSLPGKNKLRGIITYGARARALCFLSGMRGFARESQRAMRALPSRPVPVPVLISPTAFEHSAQARGEALWERVEAGSGSLGAASSESAAGSGRLSGPAAMLSRPRLRSSR